jgi:hypothetical protein
MESKNVTGDWRTQTSYDHIIDRNLVKWGTYGKFGNKPLRWVLIKDLSDSHLLHIIEHIKIYIGVFGHPLLNFMKEEATYRTKNNIFIPDYE